MNEIKSIQNQIRSYLKRKDAELNKLAQSACPFKKGEKVWRACDTYFVENIRGDGRSPAWSEGWWTVESVRGSRTDQYSICVKRGCTTWSLTQRQALKQLSRRRPLRSQKRKAVRAVEEEL